MVHLIATSVASLRWWEQYLHPGQLRTPNGGYWFWSGIGSDIGEVLILGGLITLVRHHNCHVDKCWRIGHRDPANGHPACKKHHSQGHLTGADLSISAPSQEVLVESSNKSGSQ